LRPCVGWRVFDVNGIGGAAGFATAHGIARFQADSVLAAIPLGDAQPLPFPFYIDGQDRLAAVTFSLDL